MAHSNSYSLSQVAAKIGFTVKLYFKPTYLIELCLASIWLLAISALAVWLSIIAMKTQHQQVSTPAVIGALLNNLSAGLIGAVSTVIAVEVLARQRERQTEKQQLVTLLRTGNHEEVRDALKQLEVRGWLRSGDLDGVNLGGADLSGQDLTGMVLRCSDMFGANLSGAILFEADLRYSNLEHVNITALSEDAVSRKTDFNKCDLRHCKLLPSLREHLTHSGARM